MTLIDAMAKGGKFKRTNQKDWVWIQTNRIYYVQDQGLSNYLPTVDDIKASDWEIKGMTIIEAFSLAKDNLKLRVRRRHWEVGDNMAINDHPLMSHHEDILATDWEVVAYP